MKKLISIVIPIFNVQEFVSECIESVRNQSYINIEIILVDDGSNDGSEVICDKYKKVDDRIKVIHQKNAGLSAARNVGVKESKGEYIVFVDSDDMIHPKMIEILYKAMRENNADISMCSHKKIDENCKSIDIKFEENKKNEVYTGCELLKRTYEFERPLDITVACYKLYKKEYLLNEPYPIGKIHEDEFVTYKILFRLKRCVYVPYQLYYYRQRHESITNKAYNIKSLDKIEALKERKEYFHKRNEIELYLMTLRRYETALTEAIISISKSYPEKKKLVEDLNQEFKKCWKNEIRDSKIEIRHKMKYILFMLNKNIYKWIKYCYER